MSGYLEVKYPFRANLGLNPFKSWKRQWCILRPSPTYEVGGSLAVYCSEAGAPAGTVELRSGCSVKKAKSRSRPNAFAVFSIDEPCKPRILLAAQTLHEAHIWMNKIRNLLNGEILLGTEGLLKDSYAVTIIPTDLSKKCELPADSNLTLSSNGLMVTKDHSTTVIQWQNIKDILHIKDSDKNRSCIINIDGGFSGGGEIKLMTPLAGELVGAVKQALQVGCSKPGQKLSQSDGDLSIKSDGETRRMSWYSGPPSEVSLDDTDLLLSKGGSGPLSRCGLGPSPMYGLDSVERRSLLSLSSGVYEEIAEDCETVRNSPKRVGERVGGRAGEPAYESVSECALLPRRPPPLPPRTRAATLQPGAWEGAGAVSRHSSLGSLARRQPFSVFRKRLKSDSRITTSPKSENAKEKDVETKKKRFDFTPTRDIFKSFKVSRKMKNLKITNSLAKGETKSCEFLDETQHVTANRCSKSVECLEAENFDEVTTDLSLECADTDISSMDLPQEIVQLILRGPDIKVRLKENECEYMPMSPIVPPTPIDHYMVMSPRPNLA